MPQVLEPCAVCGREGSDDNAAENTLVLYGDGAGWILVCEPCRQERGDDCEEHFNRASAEERLISPTEFRPPADWEVEYELGVGD